MFVADLSGQIFGRLQVVRRAQRNRRGKATWICRCECGKETVTVGTYLRNGDTRSCGCLHRERMVASTTKHGRAKRSDTSAEYRSWGAAKTRCYNTKQPNYPNYGGRGIVMCDEWRRSFAAFYRDMGPCPPGYSIDRIDNDGPYAPGNCRWAVRAEQNSNRRSNHKLTLGRETLTLADWSRRNGLHIQTILDRLRNGWSTERALSTPAKRAQRHPDQE